MDTVIARKMWRTLEPFHSMIYFAPEAFTAYEELGLKRGRMGYFASRSAAMGRVGPAVVAATFFNFAPSLVARFIPEAWDRAEPQQLLAARLGAADAALRRFLGPELESEAMAGAAAVATEAASACRPDGRPLFAAHAALPVPDEPHLQLWHALTLLREFRGDGHTMALVSAGLSGLEAVVSYAVTGELFDADFYRRSRGWTGEEWAAGEDSLRERGWIEDDGLTEAGRRGREMIEAETDRLAMAPWNRIGGAAADHLRAVVRPWSKAIVATGGFGGPLG